jgi:hypothetical protein
MPLFQGGPAAVFYLFRVVGAKVLKIGVPIVAVLEVADQVRLSRGRPGSGLIVPFPIFSGGQGDLPGPDFALGIGQQLARTSIAMPPVWNRDP